MSNIFINRNRDQGAYNSAVLNQKFLSTEQAWSLRAKMTQKGMDKFHQQSLRYSKNPDLSPKHVGLGWSIVDACDTVRPNAEQMKEKYRVTENSVPLHKAYNQYENPNLSYQERVEQVQGPTSPLIHPAMKSNVFTAYEHSGGISGKDVSAHINDIATKIMLAKEAKGTLNLNNRKPNGTSFKSPALDLALHAQNGGETGCRFYTKFPIYRPRGHGAPGVSDDIKSIWDKQISLHQDREEKHKARLDSMYGTLNKNKTADSFDLKRTIPEPETASRRSGHGSKKTLKLAGEITMFPKRERFNEDVKSVISETKAKSPFLTSKNLPDGGAFDARSGASQRSKKTLSAVELSKYFDEKKAQIAQDAISRVSQASKASALRARAAIAEKATAQQREAETAAKADEQAADKAEEEKEENLPPAEDAGDEAATATGDCIDAEAVSIAGSAAFDAVSVVAPSLVPTDVLEDEYQKLLEEYDTIAAENRTLENQVEAMKEATPIKENGKEVSIEQDLF